MADVSQLISSLGIGSMRMTQAPLSMVTALHPKAHSAAQTACTDYLAKDLRIVASPAAGYLLLLEPIIVVGRSKKWQRIAGFRSYQVARMLCDPSTVVPVCVCDGRISPAKIRHIAEFDGFGHRLLASLDSSGLHQVDAMAEQLLPGFRRTTAGRPASADAPKPVGMETLFDVAPLRDH